MGTGSRLGLLILTTILGGNIPPFRPPGSPPQDDDSETAECPDCETVSDLKSGRRFYCEVCNKYFIPR
jgi:hypothetical protein